MYSPAKDPTPNQEPRKPNREGGRTNAESSRRSEYSDGRALAQKLGEAMLTACVEIVQDEKYKPNEREPRLVELCVDYVEAGADVNFQHHRGSDSPLLWSSTRGFSQVVSILIECKAEVTIRDADGRTPLHAASANGHFPILQQLCEAKAPVNEVNVKGQTALMMASKNGHKDVVDFLLAKMTADLAVKDKDGYSALVEASWGGHMEICEVLLATDADVNNTGGSVRPLEQALLKGHSDVAAVLRASGAVEPSATSGPATESSMLDADGNLNPNWKRATKANPSSSPSVFEPIVAKEFLESIGLSDHLVKKCLARRYDSWRALREQCTVEANDRPKLIASQLQKRYMVSKGLAQGSSADGSDVALSPAELLLVEWRHVWEEVCLKWRDHQDGYVELVRRLYQQQETDPGSQRALTAMVEAAISKDQIPDPKEEADDAAHKVVRERERVADMAEGPYKAMAKAQLTTLEAEADDLSKKALSFATKGSSFNHFIMIVTSGCLKGLPPDTADKLGEVRELERMERPWPWITVLTEAMSFSEEEARSLVVAVESRQGHLDLAFLKLVSAPAPVAENLLYQVNQRGKSLLEAGASCNCKDVIGWSALMHATQRGSTSMVETLLGSKAEVEERSRDGGTAMMWAAGKGRKQEIELLLQAKASVNASDKLGRTPLLAAAANGYATTTRRLLQAKADTESRTQNNSSAVLMAALNGHETVVAVLAAAKAGLDHQQNGHAAAVEALEEAIPAWQASRWPSELDRLGAFGCNALMLAVHKGRVDIVRCLVEAKASLDLKDSHNETAGMVAVQKGERAITNLLLQAGAQTVPAPARLRKGVGDEGFPLHHAARFQETADEVTSLVALAPGSAFRRDHDGWLPLHRACSNTSPAAHRIVEAVLQANQEAASVKTPQKQLPLHVACLGSPCSAVVGLLISSYAKGLATHDSQGNTPLHLAAQNPTPAAHAIACLCLEGNPEAVLERGWGLELPLHVGARMASDPCLVEELVKWYKDGSLARDAIGNIPLASAARNGTQGAAAVCRVMLNAYRNGPKERVQDGATCLHVAARYSTSVEVPVLFLEAYPAALRIVTTAVPGGGVGADHLEDVEEARSAARGEGDLPLHWACRNTTPVALDIVKLLVAKDPEAVAKPGRGGNYPLHVASRHAKSSDLITFLSDNHRDIEGRSIAASIPNRAGDLPGALGVLNGDTTVIETITKEMELEGSAFLPLSVRLARAHENEEEEEPQRYQYASARAQAVAEGIMRRVAMRWKEKELVQGYENWRDKFREWKLHKPDERALGLAAAARLTAKGDSPEDSSAEAFKVAVAHCKQIRATEIAAEAAGIAIIGSVQSTVGHNAALEAAAAVMTAGGSVPFAFHVSFRAAIQAKANAGGSVLSPEEEAAIEAGKAAGREVVDRILLDAGVAAGNASKAAGGSVAAQAAAAGLAVERAGGSAVDAGLAANKAALAGKATRGEAQKQAVKAAEIAVMRGESAALLVSIQAAEDEALLQEEWVGEERIRIKRMIESTAKDQAKVTYRQMQKLAQIKKEEAEALRAALAPGTAPSAIEAVAQENAAKVTHHPEPCKAAAFAVAAAIMATGGTVEEACEAAREAAVNAGGTPDVTARIQSEARSALGASSGECATPEEWPEGDDDEPYTECTYPKKEQGGNILADFLWHAAEAADNATEDTQGSPLAQAAYAGAAVLRGGGSAVEVAAAAGHAAAGSPAEIKQGAGMAGATVVISRGGSMAMAEKSAWASALQAGASKSEAVEIVKTVVEAMTEARRMLRMPPDSATERKDNAEAGETEAEAAAAAVLSQMLQNAGEATGAAVQAQGGSQKLQASMAGWVVEDAGGSTLEAAQAAAAAGISSGMSQVESQQAAGIAAGVVESLRGGSPAACGRVAMQSASNAGASTDAAAVAAGQAAGGASVSNHRAPGLPVGSEAGTAVIKAGGTILEAMAAAEKAALQSGVSPEEARATGGYAASLAIVDRVIEEAGKTASQAAKTNGADVERQCAAAGAAVERGGGSPVEAGVASAKVATAHGLRIDQVQMVAGTAAGAAVLSKGGSTADAGSAAGSAALSMGASKEEAAAVAASVAEGVDEPPRDDMGTSHRNELPSPKSLAEAANRSALTTPKMIRARKKAAQDGSSVIAAALAAAKQAQIAGAQASTWLTR